MRLNATLAIIFVAIVGLLSSCTIMQRRYMPGFYIESRFKNNLSAPSASSFATISKQHDTLLAQKRFYSVNNTVGTIKNNAPAGIKHNYTRILKITHTLKQPLTQRNVENKTPVYDNEQPEFPPATKVQDNELAPEAIGSFVCGILAFVVFYSLILSVQFIAFLLAIFAIVLAVKAWHKKDECSGMGFATTGFILGIIMLIGFLVLAAAFL